MTLSRRKKITLAAGVLAGAVAAVFLTTRKQAGSTAPVRLDEVVALVPVPVDTPPRLDARPRLRPAAGWPFQQLPMVEKFDVPVPRVVAIPLPVLRPVYIKDVPVTRTVPSVVAVAADPDPAPLWLLPVAAGVGSGGGTTSYGTATPEPSTLLLLSGGLALLGLQARHRRRG